MQTRYKILVLLFTATVILGAVTFTRFGNDSAAVLRFRSLFSYQSLYSLKYALTSVAERGNPWYAGLSLFAILMIVLVFRVARRDRSESLRERSRPQRAPVAKLRPREMAPANAEVESVLRQQFRRLSDLLEAKDSTITELENNLSGKQQLLQSRSQELESLKTKLNALTEQLADLRLAKEQAENTLQQELKKLKVLPAKDSVIAELENSLATTRELLQSRTQELEPIKSQVNALTDQLTDLRLAKERAENALERELAKIKALQEKDSTIPEHEKSLSGQVEALQMELSEKQELLRNRTKELKAARSKVKTLRDRLNALASTKQQTENVLQQQLKQKTELLQSKDAAIREIEESTNKKVRALEEQLEEKEKLLKDRDGERVALGSELNSGSDSDPARERAKSLLLQELQNRAELLQERDALVKELQERLNTTVHSLESARTEVERLMQQRDAELPEQSTTSEAGERKGLNNKLLELGTAKAQAAVFPQAEEGKRVEGMDPTLKEPGETLSVPNQGSLLATTDEAMESDNALSEGRKAEPKEPG